MAIVLAELSDDEVRKTVAADLGSQDFRIKEYKILPASDNPLGFLGDHCRITVHVQHKDKNKVLHYFEKKIPTKVQSHYDYAQQTRAFYKEIELYKTLIKDLKNALDPSREKIKWQPNFYYSRGSDIFVVEDVSFQDFYMLQERSLMDLDHVQVLIDTMATMHAASLIFEEKLNAGKAKTLSTKFTPGKPATIWDLYGHLLFETEAHDEKGHPGNTFWEAGIKSQLAVIDHLPNLTETQRKSLHDNLVEKMRLCLKFVKPSKTFRNVFLHGDLWANNILFRKNQQGQVSDAMMVDFQLARYGPPAHDLVMSLYLIQNREFRKKHEAELFNRYYERFSQELAAEGFDANKLLSRVDFDASVSYYREYALLNCIAYFQLILTPSHIVSEFLSSPELFDKNFNVDRSEMIVASYKSDDICYNRITEAMMEMIEFYKWT